MAYKLNIGPNVSTTDHTNFRRPCTPAKIKTWWAEVKQNIPNYANYNWYLVGGMVGGSQSSKDADVVMTPLSGEIYDTSELATLQSIMTSATQIALNNSFMLDLTAAQYHWASRLGFTRDFFHIKCWDRIFITIDGDEGEKSNVFNRTDATVEKLSGVDLWKTSWTNNTSELYFPFGSIEKAKTYNIGCVAVEEWCNTNKIEINK
jgi:hypothetical protein